MSGGEHQSKKRKDRKKKKAMLEALQQEEYKDERAHVRMMDDDEEDFVVHQAEPDDLGALIQEDQEGNGGSGFCAKIIFLVLLASLGLAVGVIFFEMGGLSGPLGELVGIQPITEVPEVHTEPPFDPTEDYEPAESVVDPTSTHSEPPDAFDETNIIEEAIETVVENLRDEAAEQPVGEPELEEESAEQPVEEEPQHMQAAPSLMEEIPYEEEAELVEETQPEPVVEQESEDIPQEPEAPVENLGNFEAQLEDDTPEVPQESYTMRAEREAVQEAVDQVWVLTVRCVEELRALQTLARSTATFGVIETITKRLEPLRNQLDQLVQATSSSIFDGALEQAAHLERSLRAVLDDLDDARNQDAVLAEQEALKEEIERAAREALVEPEIVDEVAAEPEIEVVSEVEVVEPEPEPEPLVESIPEPVPEPIPEPVVEAPLPKEESQPEPVDVPVAVEPVPEPVVEITEPEALPVADEPVEVVPEVVEPVAEPEEPIVQVPQPVAAPIPEPEPVKPVEEPIQVATEAFTVQPPVVEKVAAEEKPAASLNLEEADRLVDQSPSEALTLMEQILEREPANPLALYGRARALDTLAEVEKSNARLEQAIFAYRAILDLERQVGDDLYRRAGLRCIDRMRFRGFHNKATRIQQRLVARFPDEIDLQNQLAIGFLLANQPESARTVLEQTLGRWPDSGFAQVHLGFILKTTYNDNEAGVELMKKGIASREEGVIDGRFYFHLGDGLNRLGRQQEAQQVYIEGEREGVFLSREQRSLYNVDRLTARPWWTKEETTYGAFLDLLESNWRQIRDEAVALLSLNPPEGFSDEAENLRDKGDWKQFELFARGRKIAQHCNRAPKTCALIEDFPPALCRRGQVKFSVMHPATHVWPHTGPTNCRLRSHLGLVVPGGASIRVSNTTRSWEEGKVMVFDDSFEHEVWHNGSSYRLVLIVDLWHPELTLEERKSLAAI